MSRKTYTEARWLTPDMLATLPVGTVVQVSLGFDQRLLLRKTADGRMSPIKGASITVGALVEVAELLASRSA
ncbi:MAG TPA: hypothetical protein VN520_00485 [Streptomyces sp.]|uniref:hypothetical protein n=1 Tax=Streptomyces sp. TaxID=1931 RepID=UPI002B9A1C3B|nr:hypothetical protein [Streptomyces sp.]HWU04883.1 hypothetical protein [Streptomyces sp.]